MRNHVLIYPTMQNVGSLADALPLIKPMIVSYPSTWSDKTFKTSASQQFNLDPLEFDFCDLDEVSNVRLDYPFS